MLIPENKLKRGDISWTLLTRFLVNPKNFHRKIITQDENWVTYFESYQTMEISDSHPTNKSKQAESVHKRFWRDNYVRVLEKFKNNHKTFVCIRIKTTEIINRVKTKCEAESRFAFGPGYRARSHCSGCSCWCSQILVWIATPSWLLSKTQIHLTPICFLNNILTAGE